MSESNGFEGWAVLELMGHRKLAGKVSEATVGGAALLRLDIFEGDGDTPALTQFYSSAAVYCITPASEKLCRMYANTPAPVIAFEIPMLTGPATSGYASAGDDGGEWSCDDDDD